MNNFITNKGVGLAFSSFTKDCKQEMLPKKWTFCQKQVGSCQEDRLKRCQHILRLNMIHCHKAENKARVLPGKQWGGNPTCMTWELFDRHGMGLQRHDKGRNWSDNYPTRDENQSNKAGIADEFLFMPLCFMLNQLHRHEVDSFQEGPLPCCNVSCNYENNCATSTYSSICASQAPTSSLRALLGIWTVTLESMIDLP